VAERSVFQKLVDTLPERERKDLLDKINRSTDLDRGADESIYHKELSKEERERLVDQDLAKLSPFGRFLLWLRGMFSGKNRKQLIVASKIRALKGAINRKSAGLTGFETRDLTPKLAESFYQLYLRTLPLAEIYRRLASQSREMRGSFVELFEEEVPEARVGLRDVVPMESLEAIYEQKGAEAAVRHEVLLKAESYVAHIDQSLFDEMESQLTPFFYAKDVIFFPYADFFQLFHVNREQLSGGKRPPFASALALVALDYLEKMYFAIYTALRAAEQGELPRAVIRFLASLSLDVEGAAPKYDSTNGGHPAEERSGDADEDDASDAESAEEALAAEVERINEEFATLYREIRRFEHEMPLAELVRYFLRDPYYKLYLYLPRMHLREYYLAMFKIRLLAELSDTFDQLRVQVVDRQIAKLFGGLPLAAFEGYRAYNGAEYGKVDVPAFAHARSLNVLYNYIRLHYRSGIQEVVKILGNIVLVQNRISRNKLLQYASTVEDLEQKIKEFDESLRPETIEGKVFHRLRDSLASDSGRLRAFRAIVAQRDSQAAALVERGRENLSGLQAAFREVSASGGEPMKERLETNYYLDGSLVALSAILDGRAERIGTFLVVLNQLVKAEGG